MVNPQSYAVDSQDDTLAMEVDPLFDQASDALFKDIQPAKTANAMHSGQTNPAQIVQSTRLASTPPPALPKATPSYLPISIDLPDSTSVAPPVEVVITPAAQLPLSSEPRPDLPHSSPEVSMPRRTRAPKRYVDFVPNDASSCMSVYRISTGAYYSFSGSLFVTRV